MTVHPRLCIVAGTPLTVRAFLLDQIRSLGCLYDVTVVSSFTTADLAELGALGIRAMAVPIERRVSPWRDLKAVRRLWRLFRDEGFDAVHSVTPKAGLLAMGAARLAGVRVRVHVFTGQVWVTRTWPARGLLKAIDRLIASLATLVLVDSPSQRDFLNREGVICGVDARVLGDGSISGVDTQRFRPDARAREGVRSELTIAQDAPIAVFLGRLNVDKGVVDLAEAFESLPVTSRAALVLVGPDEAGLRGGIEERCLTSRERLRFVGATDVPQRYLAAADILVLPSYREGFGTAVIEAAACGVPAVASRIYGLTDAIEDGVTGLLHRPRDAADLAAKLATLLDDAPLRHRMGAAARARVLERFDQSRLSEAVVDLHVDALQVAARGRHLGWRRILWVVTRRALDVLVSLAALVALAPLLAWIAWRVRGDVGRPVLFRQRRAGLHGRAFTLVKFRTMRDLVDTDGRQLEDAARLTGFGRWLRDTSLDELLEFWNVLRGDMSLVGPRPLPIEYLERYSATQARRHEVRPGITGWAQVNGRNAVSWPERFDLDVWYVDHRTLALDLRILVRTVWIVFSRQGVNEPGHVTMSPFTGEEER